MIIINCSVDKKRNRYAKGCFRLSPSTYTEPPCAAPRVVEVKWISTRHPPPKSAWLVRPVSVLGRHVYVLGVTPVLPILTSRTNYVSKIRPYTFGVHNSKWQKWLWPIIVKFCGNCIKVNIKYRTTNSQLDNSDQDNNWPKDDFSIVQFTKQFRSWKLHPGVIV